jgi:hypothetical protein
VLAFSAPALFAQLPAARLHTIFPPGATPGASVAVTVGGQDLDDLAALRFSHAGITAKPVEKEGKREPNKFLVSVARDVPLGVYDARVTGRFGVSNPRAFAVGHLPERIAPATNTSAAAASALTPGEAVHSRIYPNTVAWFSLALTQGQRVFVECQARELDSRMDPALVLSDDAGRELARARTGGLLDFTAPAAETYWLRVSDFLYRGGDDYFYRLAVSTGPRVDCIFPPAGLPGDKARFTVLGRNLPGGKPAPGLSVDGRPLEQVVVEIALPATAPAPLPAGLAIPSTAAALDGSEHRLNTPHGPSNPVLLGLATAPVVVEQEPNDAPARAQTISPPCEVAGRFFPADDRDVFTFSAKKGEGWWLEVISQRLGLPTSPFVLVQRVTTNAKGEEETSDVQELHESDANAGGAEFSTRTRDPGARFEAKEDGTYRVVVRDLFNRARSDPRHVYRLALRRETPDFRLVALPVPPSSGRKDAKDLNPGALFLRRGETAPLKVLALRRDGFNGEIQLAVEGLPADVTAAPAQIEAGKTTALVLLTAGSNASDWVGPLRVVGRAIVGGAPLAREARSGALVWSVADPANETPQGRLARELVLAVGHEVVPVSVAAERPMWEATAGAKVRVPLHVARFGDFNGEITLKPAGLAALDSAKELKVDGKTNRAVLELDFGAQKLPVGAHTFWLQGQTQGKYRKDFAAVNAAENDAKAARDAAADLAESAKQAAKAAEKAARAAAAAEERVKASQEKLGRARFAAEGAPQNEALVSARNAAEKEAEEAEASAKAAAAAKAAAESAVKEAEAKAKEAEQKQAAAAKRAKELADKEKPRDLTVAIYSAPITVKVAEAEKKK